MSFGGREVFKLQFESGEYDMVVRDLGSDTCEIYEVKHSTEVVDEQARHLRDGEKRKATERAFGKIVSRTVLYRGLDAAGRAVQPNPVLSRPECRSLWYNSSVLRADILRMGG